MTRERERGGVAAGGGGSVARGMSRVMNRENEREDEREGGRAHVHEEDK